MAGSGRKLILRQMLEYFERQSGTLFIVQTYNRSLVDELIEIFTL